MDSYGAEFHSVRGNVGERKRLILVGFLLFLLITFTVGTIFSVVNKTSSFPIDAELFVNISRDVLSYYPLNGTDHYP